MRSFYDASGSRQFRKQPALHLFADSLYRLRVNGQIVGFGPARFLPAYPEYDSYDLKPWLRPGENTVLVEVHSRGVGCFQALSSRGGFIASGRVGLDDGSPLDFSTPGDWLVCRTDAWEAQAEAFSFAQGPIEILDARRLPVGYPEFPGGSFAQGQWQEPTILARGDHWGRLQERSISSPSLERVAPASVTLVSNIKNSHVRQGFNAGNLQAGERLPFFTHLYSPHAQEIDLGVFWGPVFVNGQLLEQANCTLRGNRQNAQVPLRAGWNFIYGLPEMLKACWTWLMEMPDTVGLLLRALPTLDCAFTFGPGYSAASFGGSFPDHRARVPGRIAGLSQDVEAGVVRPRRVLAGARAGLGPAPRRGSENDAVPAGLGTGGGG